MGLINSYYKTRLFFLIRSAWNYPDNMKLMDFWIELVKTGMKVEEIREMTQGYKTYIVAGLTIAVAILHALGYIDDSTYQTLLGLLAAGGISTVAAKINRIASGQDAIKLEQQVLQSGQNTLQQGQNKQMGGGSFQGPSIR